MKGEKTTRQVSRPTRATTARWCPSKRTAFIKVVGGANDFYKKFFTSSIEMRNILEQIREVQNGFPFETTIKAETFGKGKTKYIFT